MHRFCILSYFYFLSAAQQVATIALLFVKELEFLSFKIHRNCQLYVRRWRKPESLSPVHHADISCFSDKCCGIQNKSFIWQLSMPGVLSNNIEFCLQIIHYYLWHVLESVQMSRASHRESPKSRFWNRGNCFTTTSYMSTKKWPLRRSRSFKVTDFGTKRKLICDFLLVINSNLPPILYRFRDIAYDRSKIAIWTAVLDRL